MPFRFKLIPKIWVVRLQMRDLLLYGNFHPAFGHAIVDRQDKGARPCAQHNGCYDGQTAGSVTPEIFPGEHVRFWIYDFGFTILDLRKSKIVNHLTLVIFSGVKNPSSMGLLKLINL
jgi:hypothetical protein